MRTNTMVRGLATVGVLAVAVAVASCDELEVTGPGPDPAEPGQLIVSVESGQTGTAFRFRVTGQGMSAPEAASTDTRLFSVGDSTEIRALAVGRPASGELMRINVPDVNRAGSYEVTLEAVAGPDHSLMPLSSHSLSIDR